MLLLSKTEKDVRDRRDTIRYRQGLALSVGPQVFNPKLMPTMLTDVVGVPSPLAKLFPTFSAMSDAQSRALAMATEGGSIILSGATRTGKSAIAARVVGLAAASGRTCRWLSYEALMTFLQQRLELSKHGHLYADEFADRMDAWWTLWWELQAVYEVLVIDDIGRTAAPEFFRAELPSLLRARHDNGVDTILTTNLSRDAFIALWDERLTEFIRSEFLQITFSSDYKVK